MKESKNMKNRIGLRAFVLLITAAFLFVVCGCSKNSGDDSASTTNVTPEKLAVEKPSLSNEQEKEILYTVYSGIAPSNKDSKEKNELYNAMFADINGLVGEMSAMTIANDFITPINGFPKSIEVLLDIFGFDIEKVKYLKNNGFMLILGQSQTFVYSNDKYDATLAVSNDSAGVKDTFQNMFKDLDIKKIKDLNTMQDQLNGIVNNLKKSYYRLKFVGNLSVKLKSGYQSGDVFYKNMNSLGEITARIEGVITAKTVTEKGIEKLGIVPELNSVDIYIESIQARYPDFWINYINWEASYAIKEDITNLYLIPADINAIIPADTPDNRLYTLKGKLLIEDKPYSMNMKYAQTQTETGRFIAMAGTVNTPLLEDKIVKISTQGMELLDGNSAVDTAKMIGLNENNNWISGSMDMESTKTEIVNFNADGSVKLSEGSPVADWQNAFNFIK